MLWSMGSSQGAGWKIRTPYVVLYDAGEGAEPRGSVERAYVRYVAPIVDDAAAAGYDLDEADEAWLAARRAKVRQMALARGEGFGGK